MRSDAWENGVEISQMTDKVTSKAVYFVMGRIVLVVAILLVLALTACGKGKGKGALKGDVSVVDLEPGTSNLYSQEDIYDAMEEVTEHFAEEFPGCMLTNLVYDEAYSLQSAEQWAKQYGDEEAIVFLSSFDVSETGGDGSLEPGQTYRDWQWILTRDKGEDWELQTWGY